MKFVAVAFAALAASAAAQLPDCNLVKLVQVVGGDNGKKCSADSGYSSTSGVQPTDAQFGVLCFNDACSKYREELKAAAPTECLLGTIFNPAKPLYATLITPIEDECKKRRTPAPGPAPTTQAPAPGPGPAPTPAPTDKQSC